MLSKSDNFHMIPLIVGSQKNGTDELIYKAETTIEKGTYEYRKEGEGRDILGVSN